MKSREEFFEYAKTLFSPTSAEFFSTRELRPASDKKKIKVGHIISMCVSAAAFVCFMVILPLKIKELPPVAIVGMVFGLIALFLVPNYILAHFDSKKTRENIKAAPPKDYDFDLIKYKLIKFCFDDYKFIYSPKEAIDEHYFWHSGVRAYSNYWGEDLWRIHLSRGGKKIVLELENGHSTTKRLRRGKEDMPIDTPSIAPFDGIFGVLQLGLHTGHGFSIGVAHAGGKTNWNFPDGFDKKYTHIYGMDVPVTRELICPKLREYLSQLSPDWFFVYKDDVVMLGRERLMLKDDFAQNGFHTFYRDMQDIDILLKLLEDEALWTEMQNILSKKKTQVNKPLF